MRRGLLSKSSFLDKLHHPFNFGFDLNDHSYKSNFLVTTPLQQSMPHQFLNNINSYSARLNSHYKTWSYTKKKYKRIKAYRESLWKRPAANRFLLILELKPLRSQVKGKHSIGTEFQSLAVRRKELLT